MIVDEKNATIFLYEYGDDEVKNWSSYSRKYKITMRTSDGKDNYLTGTMYSEGDRVYIDDKYRSIVLDALSKKENSSVSFFIEQNDFMSTYLFDIPTGNFAEQYNSLKAN